MKVKFHVVIHEDKKLFYVATHKTNTKTRISWKNIALKAKSSYNTFDNHAPDGITIAMVNTNYTGWHDMPVSGEYGKENGEYLRKKQEIIEEYEEQGYVNLGLRMKVSNDTGEGKVKAGWTNKFSIAHMNKKKIMEKIDLINRSLQLNIPANLYNEAYMEIVTHRQTYWFEVDSMWTLLKFVRIKMGLETNLSLAA
jgi:hypothetical protein